MPKIKFLKIRKEIWKIRAYLLFHFKIPKEGSASAEELQSLIDLIQRKNAKLICEIGLNVGFSSLAFLIADPNVKVISFDIGEYSYVKLAKSYIDKKFPGRHKLICGDSKITVPQFSKENPQIRFELIFIDGSHKYEDAKKDIVNCQQLATEKTAVVIDDLTPWLPWGKGPTQAWLEAIREGLIVQEEIYKDGKPVNEIIPSGKRSWALGYYVFPSTETGKPR